MSCKCQECGRQFKVDIIVSNTLWEKIKLKGSGLLCGACIMNRIEALNQYDYYFLKKEEK